MKMLAPILPTISEAKKNLPLKRVLLAQGSADFSDPIHGLAKEFQDQGIDVHLAGDSLNKDPAKWLKLSRKSQALIFIRYHNGDGRFLQRQLCRSKLLGCAVVRWWVGTDVLNCLATDETMRAARAVDRGVDLNIAVSPHLVKELEDIGIKAQYVPSLCDLGGIGSVPGTELPKGVLTYLPTRRRAFYGEAVLIRAIEENPDLRFFIVGDESHSLQHYPNVNSLGWVENLEDTWPEIGVLLRITEHDGMPRMILEALARSRYVIYSQLFEGCWFAKSPEQVSEHLAYFRKLNIFNGVGPTITHEFSGNAGSLYSQSVVQLIKPALSFAGLKSALAALPNALPTLLPALRKPARYPKKPTY